MRKSLSTRANMNKSLYTLYERHSQFHKFLDRLAAQANDTSEIELLLNLRQFNMDCLTKYADLIIKKDITLEKPKPQHRYPYNGGMEESNMTLWNIHGQLARFIPVYAEALRDEKLSRVAIAIIAHNQDCLVRLKDDMLHPLDELQLS